MQWLVYLSAVLGTMDYRAVDVPLAYQGTWSLDAKFCQDELRGPAVVRVMARTIEFYEDTGYLTLAQLNYGYDPPEFYGRFSFVKNLSFYDEVIRLDLIKGKLSITRDATDLDAEPNPVTWVKCGPKK